MSIVALQMVKIKELRFEWQVKLTLLTLVWRDQLFNALVCI